MFFTILSERRGDRLIKN